MILKIVCTNNNKKTKHSQQKIMCGEMICTETLYESRPYNTKIKNKLN